MSARKRAEKSQQMQRESATKKIFPKQCGAGIRKLRSELKRREITNRSRDQAERGALLRVIQSCVLHQDQTCAGPQESFFFFLCHPASLRVVSTRTLTRAHTHGERAAESLRGAASLMSPPTSAPGSGDALRWSVSKASGGKEGWRAPPGGHREQVQPLI